MKLKIKIKVLTGGYMPSVIEKGDWIDLICAEDVILKAPQSGVLREKKNEHGVISRVRNVEAEVTYIPLGVAMELPKGYEAIVLPRSSTPKRFGIICGNSMGVIDNSYCGNEDEWKFPAVAIRPTSIEKGTRICQFRVQLSQKATVWQKIKWLFTSGVKLVEVDDLGDDNRGGFGSTGVK